MQCTVMRLVSQTVIKYQNCSYKLNVWKRLISRYRHRCIMDRIRCDSFWKLHVCDYIIFHFEQTYEAMMECRRFMKSRCLPFIFDASQKYQRRRLSAKIISHWYKHQINKRNLVQIIRGVHKLCAFRRKYSETSMKRSILLAWLKYRQSKQRRIACFAQQINKNKVRSYLLYLQKKAILNIQKRKILNFRETKRARTSYLKLQRQRKEAAACVIQSYFRMFYVRSIMNDVQSKLTSIDHILSIHTDSIKPVDIDSFCDFAELNENEFMFDESIIDFHLKPLTNPVWFCIDLLSLAMKTKKICSHHRKI